MSRHWFRVSPLVAVAVALSMIFAAPAGASRAPTAKQGRDLANAVYASSVGGINSTPKTHYRVTGQRISSVSSSWAKEELVARSGFQSSFQATTVVAVKLAGTTRWVVVDLGTAEVGCGIAPNKVLSDLFKTKHPCPSGGIG